MTRKHRRADGSLRPTYRRYKARKARERRREWLTQFKPGDRERFFNHVVVKDAVFLASFQKTTGLDRPEAAALLEQTAQRRHWRKLRTAEGLVVGIAPARRTVTQEEWVVMAGSTLYAARPSRAEAEAVMEEQRGLAQKFGAVRVEQRVAGIDSARHLREQETTETP